MKLHHIFGIIVFIALVVIGIFVWARPEASIEPADDQSIDSTTETLQGTWLGEGLYDDGSEWYMRYTFTDPDYSLETDSTYSETGTYHVSKTFEDGSVEIEKTYKNGERTFAMIVNFTDENTINIEGVALHRVTE